MYQNKKSVLIFGVGDLQKSIINRAHMMGLYVIGIDPCADAYCKNDVDAFEIVGGQDFEGTCAVVEKYGVDAIVTAATDKPLVMMARIAEKYKFPFYSVKTAEWSTDKFQMKRRFEIGEVPHAQGRLVTKADEVKGLSFPLIVKPRDNSGSRGVVLCRNLFELQEASKDALSFSHLDSVLVEEFIEGQEYSIEGLHYDGKTEVIQFTEKTTTPFPYNVELAHKQPANLTSMQRDEITAIICKIAHCMKYENCPSHTELKINSKGVFVIETSPRLGGGNITSHLVPLSTGVNMEDQLLHIALGEQVDTNTGRINQASGVSFLNFGKGKVKFISNIEGVTNWPNLEYFNCKLKVGDNIDYFKSGLDRYGEFIVSANNREALDFLMSEYSQKIDNLIEVSND